MTTNESDMVPDRTGLTRDIVATFVSHNPLAPGDLPGLITAVHAMLQTLSAPSAPVPASTARPVPAISVRKSITPEFLYCLEDGKAFKSLKRHLRSKYNLTPEAYRARWNLPPDYPMVAPNYASERSQLAKAMGLGKDRRSDTAE